MTLQQQVAQAILANPDKHLQGISRTDLESLAAQFAEEARAAQTAMKRGIRRAKKASSTSKKLLICALADGKADADRVERDQRFQPITPLTRFPDSVVLAFYMSQDYTRGIRACGATMRKLTGMGFELDAYTGHPNVSHSVTVLATGDTYFINLYESEWA